MAPGGTQDRASIEQRDAGVRVWRRCDILVLFDHRFPHDLRRHILLSGWKRRFEAPCPPRHGIMNTARKRTVTHETTPRGRMN